MDEGVEEWLRLVVHAVDTTLPKLQREDMNDFVQPIVQRWNTAVFVQKRLWQVWTKAPWIKEGEIPFNNFWANQSSVDTPLTVVMQEWKRTKQNAILQWLHPTDRLPGPRHVFAIFGLQWASSTTTCLSGHYTLMHFDTVKRVQSFYDPEGNMELAAAVESDGIITGYKWRAFGSTCGMQNKLFEGASPLIMCGFCLMSVLLISQCCHRLQYYNMRHVECVITEVLPQLLPELVLRQEFLIRWIWNITYINSWGGLLACMGLYQDMGSMLRNRIPPDGQKCYAFDRLPCSQKPVEPEVYCERHRYLIRSPECAPALSLPECFQTGHRLFVHPDTVNKPPDVSPHAHQLVQCMRHHCDSVILKREWPQRWDGLHLGDMYWDMGCAIQKNGLVVDLQDNQEDCLTELCQTQLGDSADVFGVVLVTCTGCVPTAMHHQLFARRASQHTQVRMLLVDGQLVVYDGPRRQSNTILNDMIKRNLVSLRGLLHVRLSDSGDGKLLTTIADSPSTIVSLHVNVEDSSNSLDALKTMMLHALRVAENFQIPPSQVFDNNVVATICIGQVQSPHRISVTTTMCTCKRICLRLGSSPLCADICAHLHLNLPEYLQMYDVKVVGNPASWFETKLVTSRVAIMKIAFENVVSLDCLGWHRVIQIFTNLRNETRELHLCLRSQPPLVASNDPSIPKVIIDALAEHEKDWITELHVTLDGLPLRSLPQWSRSTVTIQKGFKPVFKHLHHIELHSVRGDVNTFDTIRVLVSGLEACCPCLEYLCISTEYQPTNIEISQVEQFLMETNRFVLVLVLGQVTFTVKAKAHALIAL